MNEKIYKTVVWAGVVNLSLGIIVAAVGVVSGILMIISGARLLKRKNEITI
ncbi:MAG: hypothetical protein HFH59_08670 [Lachnospiraceae bacterium]|jgi:hypothetical protein|nr:hypothetical protein [Lachnospiraceae bacterium]MCI9099950.1 hypothetical protein [Lachnospiraceae bacterium]MCI9357597.1 hypothetical protein [Lachnospiraceae bacterium]